jgi:hypothetical protein
VALSIEQLAAFEPDSMLMITGSSHGYDGHDAWRIAVERMKEAVRVASANGFAGWYDLEIFSDDRRGGTDLPDSLWKLPAAEMIQRGQQGLLRAWDTRHGQKPGA